MMSGKPPIEIDLIECLYTDGAVPVPIMMRMGGKHAWIAANKLIREGVAAMWVKSDGAERQMLDWECDALVRARLHGSTEETPGDEALTLKPTELIRKLYHERFGAWYDENVDDLRSDGPD